jgi:hypothetical protein
MILDGEDQRKVGGREGITLNGGNNIPKSAPSTWTPFCSNDGAGVAVPALNCEYRKVINKIFTPGP